MVIVPASPLVGFLIVVPVVAYENMFIKAIMHSIDKVIVLDNFCLN